MLLVQTVLCRQKKMRLAEISSYLWTDSKTPPKFQNCALLPQKEETERQREVCERSSLPFLPLRKQASSLAFSHRGLTLWFQFFVLTCILTCFSGSNSCRGLFEKCQTYANELLCLLNKLLGSQQILEINALSVVRFGRMKMDSRLINCVVLFPQLHSVAKKE